MTTPPPVEEEQGSQIEELLQVLPDFPSSAKCQMSHMLVTDPARCSGYSNWLGS